MLKSDEQLSILYQMICDAVANGIAHLDIEDEKLDGRSINSGGKALINFASCSYLGLETDQRLKAAAIDAVMRFGTQFSSSRAYVSTPLYKELETLFSTMFEASVVIAPTTSLGHLSALPTLIRENDCVVLDQQVHTSVQTAAKLVSANGVHSEILRHNRLDLLEERINVLRRKYRRIWYLADGVYSMYGDLAPMDDLTTLLDSHEQLHLYVDDAHGVSWAGQHGRGVALGNRPIHERLVVAISLAKGFGAGGAALLFSDSGMAHLVRSCGGPMLFSGPIQPAVLGAAIQSARIHYSPEIKGLQVELQERIRYCNELLIANDLPLLSTSNAPIRYVGIGLPRVAQRMVHRLMECGYYSNIAMFPAVPMRRAGVRFTLTRHQTKEDIKAFVDAFAVNLPKVLDEEGYSRDEIAKSFGLNGKPPRSVAVPSQSRYAGLQLEHHTTIRHIDRAEWDGLLADRGSFSWEGLRYLEEVFQGNPEPENNWQLHYFIVRDARGKPVLATFFTDALWKDDMLFPEAVSRRVEEERRNNPYFLVSRTFAMGSLLTEGEHLFIDRTGEWQKAMRLLLEAASAEQSRCKAGSLVLRDFPGSDPEMDAFLLQQGFTKHALPDSFMLEPIPQDDTVLLRSVCKKTRKELRRKVLSKAPHFDIEILRKGARIPSDDEWKHIYSLYRNVKERNLEINTFDLPEKIFRKSLEFNCWELVLLYPKAENDLVPSNAVSVGACFVGQRHYSPMVIGLDYDWVESHGAYRAALYSRLLEAQRKGLDRIYWGMGAPIEKKRFGAKPRNHCAYMQVDDHYSFEVLERIKNEAGLSHSAV